MRYTMGLALGLMLALPAVLPAQEPDCTGMDCVVAKRGTAVVTIADVVARAQTLDSKQRRSLLSTPQNLNQMLENMLAMRQIANEYSADAIKNDPVLLARLGQVRDEVIAVRQLDKIRDERITGDFEALAKEHYAANPDLMKTPAESVVRHLLIGTANRTQEEALARANELYEQLKTADEKTFQAAVTEYSEDPGKGYAEGLVSVPENSTDLDPAFIRGAFEVQSVGQVSKPVLSSFGYHLIYLTKRQESQKIPYEDVREAIIEKLRQEARRRVVTEYRAELMASGETVLNQAQLDAALEAAAAD